MLDLFADTPPWQEPLAPGAAILRRFAPARGGVAAGDNAGRQPSPFRQMVTPGGYTMSVAMTNCGRAGLDHRSHGYLYAPDDPLTGQRWPPMPTIFRNWLRRRRLPAAILILPRCLSD
jgi:alkylated DNA repair protein (DNA oxidative demethylase)